MATRGWGIHRNRVYCGSNITNDRFELARFQKFLEKNKNHIAIHFSKGVEKLFEVDFKLSTSTIIYRNEICMTYHISDGCYICYYVRPGNEGYIDCDLRHEHNHDHCLKLHVIKPTPFTSVLVLNRIGLHHYKRSKNREILNIIELYERSPLIKFHDTFMKCVIDDY
jgi:hypothetical protein